MQNGKEPECVFFQQMAKRGHYKPTNSTQQGIYVCSPSGKFLGSINSNDPNRVIALMKQGLRQWDALYPADRKLADVSLVKADDRREKKEPQDGLILTMTARDVPEDCDPDAPCAEKWNRDTAWFSQEEAISMVPDHPVVDQVFELPAVFVNRIVALHLVDTPNGQTDHFAPKEIRGSRISGRITDVTETTIKIELSGKTKSSSTATSRDRSARGVVTTLLGSATFDRKSQKFSQFEIVAVGRRWGYTAFNDRRRDAENSNPIGFVFQLAPEDAPPNVPAAIWAYNAPWLHGR